MGRASGRRATRRRLADSGRNDAHQQPPADLPCATRRRPFGHRAACFWSWCRSGGRRRCRLPEMAGGRLAAGAGHGGLARHLRRGDARAGARPVAARSRSAGPRRNAAARAGRIRPDARRLRAGSLDRTACRAAPASSPPSIARRSPLSSRSTACPPTCCLRSGAARPISAVPRIPKAPCGCWRRRPITARRKDFFRNEFLLALKMLEEGADQARRHAQLLGRRHGHDAVPAVGVLQIRRRFRRRRPPRHLEFGARCARVGGAAACRQGLAARRCIGPTRCTRPRTSTARSAFRR